MIRAGIVISVRADPSNTPGSVFDAADGIEPFGSTKSSPPVANVTVERDSQFAKAPFPMLVHPAGMVTL